MDGNVDDYKGEVLRLAGEVSRTARDHASLRSRLERLERREERRPAPPDDTWDDNTDARMKKRRIRRRDVGLTISGVGGALVAIVNLIVWVVKALQHQ